MPTPTLLPSHQLRTTSTGSVTVVLHNLSLPPNWDALSLLPAQLLGLAQPSHSVQSFELLKVPSGLCLPPPPINRLVPELSDTHFLLQDHFLFDKPVSPLLTAAGMARDWPDARGIW